MWRVIFVLTVLTATCEPYTKKHKPPINKNQRIIKVQGPPHFNHFHGHQKPFRKRPPFGPKLPGEEIIRPNHPPPIPPFFNGPSTNHVKHPRPPPHVFHKSPSYGLGFPYKAFSGYRPNLSKDKPHVKGAASPPVRSVIGTSNSPSLASSTSFHLPKFTASSFISSPPVTHIISSDDNNGPIREIPAPNLAPKHHEVAFDGVVGDLSLVGGVNGVGGIGGVSGIGISTVNVHGVEGIGGVHGVSDLSVGGGIHATSGVGGIHGVSDLSVGGGIHATSGVGEIGNVAAVGGVTHLEPEALLNSVAKSPNGVNLDAIVKDPGVEVHPYLQESGGELHGKGPTVEIANFDEGSSIDVTGLIKDAAAGSNGHHSGYEVTEHHNHLPSNDQIIKGHDGSKLYYAPDPDPSLPVQKVPPTNDPHSTPSNGQNINSLFLQPHGFSYVQGGGLAAPLSSQELFHLMHGYPAVISQPVVAFVSQPQAPGVVLSNAGHNYYQQGSGGYDGQYSQDEHEGNDISQYLQQPDIHNLLHNSHKSHHEQEILGSSHSSVVSQSVSSPPSYSQSQYRAPVKSDDSSLENSNSGNYPTSNINHNYQYEPDASETNNRNSLTVIRQASEGSLSSETVKELLLEDSASNEVGRQEQTTATIPTVLQLKNIPEVPFYASLPNKKAAEVLASLQAAGSIASDYMNKKKITRGDQGPEEEESKGRKLEEETVVEVQESVPLYETSISSKNLLEREDDDEEKSADAEYASEGQDEDGYSSLDFKEDGSSEAFGRRIRPK